MSGTHSRQTPERMPPSSTERALTEHDPLPSELLLCGRRSLHIAHNGAIYRLQSTKQGKLILTK